MPILCFWRRCDGPLPSRIFYGSSSPLLPQENRFHSNQIYFHSNSGEVFPLPEFQAKLFLMRNWVGGFYRDSLLNGLFYNELCFIILFFFSRQQPHVQHFHYKI